MSYITSVSLPDFIITTVSKSAIYFSSKFDLSEGIIATDSFPSQRLICDLSAAAQNEVIPGIISSSKPAFFTAL